MRKTVSWSRDDAYEFVKRRSWCRLYDCCILHMRNRRGWGGLAQLGEHDVRNVGVGGSNPLPSTKACERCWPLDIGAEGILLLN